MTKRRRPAAREGLRAPADALADECRTAKAELLFREPSKARARVSSERFRRLIVHGGLDEVDKSHARLHLVHLEALELRRRAAPPHLWFDVVRRVVGCMGGLATDDDHVMYGMEVLADYYGAWPAAPHFNAEAGAVFANASDLDDEALSVESRAIAVVLCAEAGLRWAQAAPDRDHAVRELKRIRRLVRRWASREDLPETQPRLLFCEAQITALRAELRGRANPISADIAVAQAVLLLPEDDRRRVHALHWAEVLSTGTPPPLPLPWYPPRGLSCGVDDDTLLPGQLLDAMLDIDPEERSSAGRLDRLFERTSDRAGELSDGVVAQVVFALAACWSYAPDHGYRARGIIDHIVASRYGIPADESETSNVSEFEHSRMLILEPDAMPPAVAFAYGHSRMAGVYADRVTAVEAQNACTWLESAVRRSRPDSRMRVCAAGVLVGALDTAMRGAELDTPEGFNELLELVDASATTGHPDRPEVAAWMVTMLTSSGRWAAVRRYAKEIIRGTGDPKERCEALVSLGMSHAHSARRTDDPVVRVHHLHKAIKHASAALRLSEQDWVEDADSDPAAMRCRTRLYLAEALRLARSGGMEEDGDPAVLQLEALRIWDATSADHKDDVLSAMLDFLAWSDADPGTHGHLLLKAFLHGIRVHHTSVDRVFRAAEAVIIDRPPWLPDDAAIWAGEELQRRLAEFAQYHHPIGIVHRSQGVMAAAAHAAARAGDLDRALVLLESGTHLLAHHRCSSGPEDTSPHLHRHQPTTANSVRRLADLSASPVVHVAATTDGAFALVTLPRSHEPTFIEIEAVTSTTVETWKNYSATETLGDPVPSTALRAARGVAQGPSVRQISRLLSAMDAVLKPIVAALPRQEPDATGFFDLITVGDFNGLPWLASAIRSRHSWLPRLHSSAQLLEETQSRSRFPGMASGLGLVVASPVPTYLDGELQSSLPHALEEGRHLQAAYQADLISGQHATRDAFLAALRRRHRFVHLAMHGEIDGSSLEQPVLLFAGSAEEEGAADSRLRADELDEDALRSDLVFLASCWTGTTSRQLPHEAIGFTSAMRRAGARAVIAPLWPITDDVTLDLVRIFYEKWLGDGCSLEAALVHAMKHARSEHPTDRTWAAFTFNGA